MIMILNNGNDSGVKLWIPGVGACMYHNIDYLVCAISSNFNTQVC